MILIVWGCSPKKRSQTTKTVAIATLMTHPALDEVDAAIREELARRGYREGQNLRYIKRNASGQIALTTNIARDLASMRPDVIVAITTPMAQAIVNTPFRPIVFAAVTDPVGAKLVHSLDKPEPGISGTSDAWSYKAQLELIHRITPKVKRLGVLHNPGEAASQYGMKRIRALAPAMGFTLVEGPVDTTTNVFSVAQSLADRVDALFLSSDNTVIGGAAGAMKVAFEKHIPLYVGDSGTVEKGGLATVSVGYHGLGLQTGALIDRVLKGERNIPTIVCTGDEVYVNTAAAAKMGVTVPQAVLSSARKVYTTIK
jgi:putative ABC transport system substrate-binding protein